MHHPLDSDPARTYNSHRNTSYTLYKEFPLNGIAAGDSRRPPWS